jgi:hypothetical protein
MCLDSKASWVEVPKGGRHFRHYPDKGILEWHQDEGLFMGEEEPQDNEQEVEVKSKRQKTSKRKSATIERPHIHT